MALYIFILFCVERFLNLRKLERCTFDLLILSWTCVKKLCGDIFSPRTVVGVSVCCRGAALGCGYTGSIFLWNMPVIVNFCGLVWIFHFCSNAVTSCIALVAYLAEYFLLVSDTICVRSSAYIMYSPWCSGFGGGVSSTCML